MKSADYWRERLKLLEESQHRNASEYADMVSKIYESATRDIEKDLAKWYTRYATNEGITLTEAKRILNTRELAEFRMDVKEYIRKGESLDPQWAAELERASVKFHVSRLEALKVQVQQAAESVKGQVSDSFDKFAVKTYSDQYYKTIFEIQKGTGVGFDVMRLDKKRVEKVIVKPWAADGRNFSERIWGDRTKLVNELHQTLSRGIIQGLSPQKMIKELSGRMGASKSNTERLIHTESAFFASRAANDAYRELEVEQYEILATLDRRTSDICRHMDGKVFKRSEFKVGVNAPPFHPRCRTTTVPYFPEDEDLPEYRAARTDDGKYYTVPASMKYPEWEKTFVNGGSKANLTEIKKEVAKKLIFTAAKSIVEAESYTRSLGVENVSFKGIDLEVANDMNQSLAEHFNDFPELKNKIHFYGSAQEKKNFLSEVVQQYYENLYKNYIKSYGKYYIDKKIKSKVTSYFKTSGEWAHAFDHRNFFKDDRFSGIAVNKKFGGDLELFKSGLKHSLNTKFHPVGCDTVKSVFDYEFGHQLDYLLDISDSQEFANIVNGKVSIETLSEYALKNRKETLAEAWAEYRNNPNPRPLAKEIGELIESKYKARFGK